MHDVLVWLKANNPLYSDIEIATACLAQLPLNGVPEELAAVRKCSDDMVLLAQEHACYVPEDGDFDTPLFEPVSVCAGAAGRLQLPSPNTLTCR